MRSKRRKWLVMKAYSSERHSCFSRNERVEREREKLCNVQGGKKEKKKGTEEETVEDKYKTIFIWLRKNKICVFKEKKRKYSVFVAWVLWNKLIYSTFGEFFCLFWSQPALLDHFSTYHFYFIAFTKLILT
jgi:hypothetical protein